MPSPLWLVLALTVACSKPAEPSAAGLASRETSGPADPWAYAPPGTLAGVVLPAGALPHELATVTALSRALDSIPSMQVGARAVHDALVVRGVNLAGPNAAAALGIDPNGALAVFMTESKDFLSLVTPSDVDRLRARFDIQPAAGPGRFDATPGGRVCSLVGRYYACTGVAATLESVMAGGRQPIGFPADLGGSLQIWLAPAFLGRVKALIANDAGLFAALRHGDGRIDLEIRAPGQLTGTLANHKSERSPLLASMPRDGVVGAALVDLRGEWAAWLDRLPSWDLNERFVGMTFGEFAAAFRGDVAACVTAGPGQRAVARFGVRRVEPVRRALRRCDELESLLPGVRLDANASTCKVRVEWLAELTRNGELTAHIADDSLVVEWELPGGGAAVPPAGGGLAEVAEHHHVLAAWSAGLSLYWVARDLKTSPTIEPDVMVFLWLWLHIAEVAAEIDATSTGLVAHLHIGTTAANPEEVSTAYSALIGQLLAGDEDVMAELDALAARFPQSPLAADLARGYYGILMLGGTVGALFGLATMPEVDYSSGHAVVNRVSRLADRACACADPDCASQVQADFMGYISTAGQPDGTEGMKRQIEADAERMMRCIMAAQGTAPDGATTP